MIVLFLDMLRSQLELLNHFVLIFLIIEHEFHAVDLIERVLQLYFYVGLALCFLYGVYWRFFATYQLVSL